MKHPNHLIEGMREKAVQPLTLKLLDGFLYAAHILMVCKMVAIPDSPLWKRLDDLDRAFTIFIQNHVQPICEETASNPTLKIKDA